MDNNIVGIAVAAVAVVGAIAFFTLGKSKTTSTTSAPSQKKPSADKNGDANRDRTSSLDKHPAGKMNVYFGSQTGTAEGFARTICNEAVKNGFEAKLCDLEDFEPEHLQESRLAVFLVATYGEGDPTDNAAKFVNWLKNEGGETEVDFLQKVDFTVFGLGNKQYEHYNKMGKSVNEMMEKLGAKRVFEYGEGDDDCSLEDDFEAWKEKLFPAMVQKYHPDAKSTRSESIHIVEKVELSFVCNPCGPSKPVIPDAHHCNSSTKHFFTAPETGVITNRELRVKPNDPGSTVHVEIDISKIDLTYHTADNLAVLPDNPCDVVDKFAQVCQYNLDEYVRIEPNTVSDSNSSDFKHPFPTPCTVRTILTSYLDIMSVPRKSVLEMFIPYLQNKEQRDWLMDIVSKNKKDVFKNYIDEECRSFYDLFNVELSSIVIPLDHLLHIIPPIQPRYYTISSSSSLHPKAIHITVSVFDKLTPGKRLVRGLCSYYLQSLHAGKSKARIFVRDSLFRLPTDPTTPIIMVGPGTGIAPMRAMLQERSLQHKSNGRKKQGENILYFGCKNPEQDYIYKDELESYQNEGVLTELQLAFSRVQKHKVYVQNLLVQEENATRLASLILNDGAYVYVCGGTSMGASVHDAFIEVLVKKGNMTKDAATAYIKDKQKNHVYVQELWSV